MTRDDPEVAELPAAGLMADSKPQNALREWRRHWQVVLATVSGMALATVLSSTFGVMLEPMEAELGWTRAEISSGPTVVPLVGLLLSAPCGYLIDRFGSRLTGLLVVALTFTAIMLMSQVGEHLWQWWAAYAIFGVAAAFTSTVWLAPVSRIFSKAKGMAIAITLSGAGISGALSPLIAEYFIQNYDWRTGFMALGMIFGAISLVLVLAFIPSDKPQARLDEAEDAGEETRQDLPGLSPIEGLKSRNLYLLFAAALIGNFVNLALLINIVPVLTFTGLSRIEAVAIAGMFGLFSIGGRLIGGWLLDTFDARRLVIIATLLTMIFPLTLIVAPGVVWATTIAVMLMAATGGLKTSAGVYMTSSYLGPRSFGLFFGIVGLNTSIAYGLGPLLANHIYDQTQSYWLVIYAAIPGFVISAALYFMMGRTPEFGSRESTPAT